MEEQHGTSAPTNHGFVGVGLKGKMEGVVGCSRTSFNKAASTVHRGQLESFWELVLPSHRRAMGPIVLLEASENTSLVSKMHLQMCLRPVVLGGGFRGLIKNFIRGPEDGMLDSGTFW